MIHKIIDESVALQLRPTRLGEALSEQMFKQIWPGEKFTEISLSISVIVVAAEYNATEKSVQALLIKEVNSYDPTKLVIKFPSGAMNLEDIDIFAAVVREFRNETGYEAKDIQFCFAFESSSTIDGERHIKVFFLAKSCLPVGMPTERDIREVFWYPFTEIGRKMPIPKNQAIALKPIYNKIMAISPDIMYALMNNGSYAEPMEGEVD